MEASRTTDAGRLVCVLGVVAAAALGIRLSAGESVRQAAVPSAPGADYRVVHGWPSLPDNTIFDEVSAVAVDSRGNVLVLQRGGRKWPDSGVLDETPIPMPTVFVFDGRTGIPVAIWGEKIFALPHSVTVDDQDNVWVTDVALHQLFKFSHDGKLLLTLGERGVAGADSSHFNRPTDVAVAPDGSFYVSDGYRNNRVLKFAADGTFLYSWGTKGKDPGQFDLPHGIALDAAGRVFVVDRLNARVQVFDGKGNLLGWKSPPLTNPQDIAVGADGTVFVTDIGEEKLPDRSGVYVVGRDGTLVGRFGRFGNYDGQFLVAHGVAVGKSGEVYVADFTGRRVQKFVPGGAQVAPQPQVTAWTPQDIRWFTPAYYTDGRQRAQLYGDSSTGGDWIDRVRIPGGSRVLAHTHPDEEIVTVVEGTWYLGIGEAFDTAKLKPYPAGSFIRIPANVAHFLAVKEGPVIVQASGHGIFRTNYLER